MRLDEVFVFYWSDRHKPGPLEDELFTTVRVAIAERGYLTADQLKKIARWKSQRALGYLENDESTIGDVTRLALDSKTPEWIRHHILCILDGVRHAMASAVLTVWDPENHTVLDYRAVEALQELKKRGILDLDPPPGQRGALPGYWTYLQTYRPIANSIGVSLRDLDRALWKWHKEKMPENWPCFE